ncbi:MAG: hypothetical protein LIP23_06730 [Planctomycetes bacterium]|nr:hypothetical protein [Planctomycetota bacterium]
MMNLEAKGLIVRLAPGAHSAGEVGSDNVGKKLYQPDARYGAHMLQIATIGSPTLKYFGYHDAPEEVWMIGSDAARPLYFVIAVCMADSFRLKAAAGELEQSDFVCLRARYNDPESSFFIMNAGVPHGEFVLPGPADAPSFYVTEPENLAIQLIGFGSQTVAAAIDGNEIVVGGNVPQ